MRKYILSPNGMTRYQPITMEGTMFPQQCFQFAQALFAAEYLLASQPELPSIIVFSHTLITAIFWNNSK
jgi:hypothetical protein